jgi:hypothetical protein
MALITATGIKVYDETPVNGVETYLSHFAGRIAPRSAVIEDLR